MEQVDNDENADPAKLHKSFKKGFKAERGKHIIPAHDGRVIFALAWLSGVGTAANRPAHHAMDDWKRVLLYQSCVKFFRTFYQLFFQTSSRIEKISASRVVLWASTRSERIFDPIGSATGGPFFLNYPMIAYNKSHNTSLDLVRHLRQRGLIIKRPNVAARKIDLIGYERLRIYFSSRRNNNLPNRPFIQGVTYKDILKIYECDILIRSICFDAVGRFEVLFRNSISEVLSAKYGSHPYDDLSAFKSSKDRIEAIQTFLNTYKKLKDQRLKHYYNKYSSPVLPPIWTMKELLTFGNSLYIFKNLHNNIRDEIIVKFGITSNDVFTSWVRCLVDLRNICAHHDRLFNITFINQPKTFKRASCPSASRTKLKGVLQCLDYLLDHRGSSFDIVRKVEKILNRFPEIRLHEAGY